jgi:hypothetical protein
MPLMIRRRLYLLAISFLAQAVVSSTALSADTSTQKYPDVFSVKVHARGSNTFDFDVTISSPYDTPKRYADAFRAMGKDGTVFGERTLVHDHATEQPFTRDLYGVNMPRGVRVVVIQARDQRYGYGGKTVEVVLPGR